MIRKRRHSQEEPPKKRKRKRAQPQEEIKSRRKRDNTDEKPKRKRKRNTIKTEPDFNSSLPYGFPMGGCTPFPPEDCPGVKRRLYMTSSKVPWVDNYFCATICGEKTAYKCPSVKAYKEYLKKTNNMGRESESIEPPAIKGKDGKWRRDSSKHQKSKVKKRRRKQ